jgi:diguanylate cyclase (GGDEF)-like protein
MAAVLSVLADGSLRPHIHFFGIMLAEVASVATLLWAWRRGDRYALWILAGLVPVLVMSFVPMLRVLGVVPHGLLSLHGLQFGHALELPVILVVLMLRSQQRRENRRRIRGMDRIDPATGLINSHVFVERLAVLVARAQRMQQPAAVLLVEIANHEAMQRAFGRKSADELPLRVAGRLLSASRDIDSVARLGELRFGMLIEGPLPPKEASGIGPRIVARCLQPFHDRPTDWNAQVRVALALVPLDGDDPARVLQRLEAVLQAVPADSRRAVFSLHDLNQGRGN